MSRPLRIEYPGAWYHVLNRGRRRETIFFDEGDYRYFFKTLEESVKQFAVKIHAYSLMPNHYHLLISTPNANLSRAMRHINGVYTQRVNKKNGYEGSLFKGRYKAILVQEDAYLLELIRYIHQNPTRAGLEEAPGEHAWTSHAAYLEKCRRPVWLCVDEVLAQFARHEKTAVRELDAFVKREVPNELFRRLESSNWPAILGNEAFKEKVKEFVLGRNLREVPRREVRAAVTTLSVAGVLKAVLLMLGADDGGPKTAMYYTAREICIRYCREQLLMTMPQIGCELELSTPAISRAYKRSLGQKRYPLILKKLLTQQ